ncbi:MAG: type I-C CRISPR-associated protein Cas8c/Csd1 [Burkholderiales bacterium RIFCSPLOWO2_02_FULL_57_36]|nr:MAG: type I-C CRISPR-associated protein Cas8c/Csd1 [Burkholderiales bacterium RIFCSPLOWO2_02_FULL_57_36]
MILQALNDYYIRRQRSSDPRDRLPAFGLEEKEIPFVIEIDAEGRLVNLADTRTIEGKKKVGQGFLVPQGVKKASGIAANLLWDTTEYVLGVDTKGKPERVALQHAAFRARLASLPPDVLSDAGIQAILSFFNGFDVLQFEALAVWPDVLLINPVMTFRLHGDVELVCQRPAVVAAVALIADDAIADGTCLVTGKAAAIERLHTAIKGVWGAQTAGANIVSFNLDAFSSYGKAQGANAPLGKPAVFAYTTALNHLLARGSRQRIQIGDASTVFWAEEAHDLETALPDLFGDPPKDEPDRGTDALKVLYQAAQSGKFSQGTSSTRFHILGLAPNAARIAIRFWETAPANELAQRIAQHFDDIRIARAPHDPEHLSLFRLLTSLAVQGKADNIPPNMGGEVMRAILQGLPYPAPFLNLAVQRSRAEQKPTYARAAVIKAALNRIIRRANLTASRPQREFQTMLDQTNANPAYLLGRLFAALEKIQEEASPGLNATIRDRYYSAASSTPVVVFTTLLRLKNHHLGKLQKGRAVQMERLIGEIIGELDDFPRNLALPEQGRFALGYYHQRQAFFTKTELANNQEESK